MYGGASRQISEEFHKDERQAYRSVSFDRIPWLEHGFGTRDTLPLAGEWRIVSLKQIHSDRILKVDFEEGCAGSADALITSRAGVLLTIRTADCLPILIAGRDRRVIAAIHAGWKGAAAGIVQAAVQRLTGEFLADPAEMEAVIGPGIGPCCYEVGEDVARRFVRFLPDLRIHDGKTRLDLAEVNRRQLLMAGLRQKRIHAGAPCTCCHPEEFHSYRRNHTDAGRMISVIGIRA